MPKNKLKRYKVVWEESRYTFVEAENEEQAVEIVMDGNMGETYSNELTATPQAFEE